MNFKGAVFDLDGTLLDSMGIWDQIDIDFLARRGLPVPEDYAKNISGLSFDDTARYTKSLFDLPDAIEEITAEWSRMAREAYSDSVELIEGAAEYLTRLKKAGVKLAVATALSRELLTPCLKRCGVYDLFDAFYTADEVGRGKDSPDMFIAAAEGLGLECHECIAFDDVLPAIKSAKKAGLIVCGVYEKNSHDHRDEIEATADIYITAFDDAPMPDNTEKR